jgi:hypothetical protein
MKPIYKQLDVDFYYKIRLPLNYDDSLLYDVVYFTDILGELIDRIVEELEDEYC